MRVPAALLTQVGYSRKTSRQFCERAYGTEVVGDYILAKAFFGAFGHALAKTYAEAVGGHPGVLRERDAITNDGEWAWEFCVQRNSKNDSGDRVDREREVRGCVQVFEEPRQGWISGYQFLALHGVENVEAMADTCDERAFQIAFERVPPQGVIRMSGDPDRHSVNSRYWPAQRDYRLWVNEDATLLVRLWMSGIAEVALREHRGATWGPPATLREETPDA